MMKMRDMIDALRALQVWGFLGKGLRAVDDVNNYRRRHTATLWFSSGRKKCNDIESIAFASMGRVCEAEPSSRSVQTSFQ